MPVAIIHPDNLVRPDAHLAEALDHPAPVVGQVTDEEKGASYPAHSHRRAQLFHIVSGSLSVETDRGSFVVPPERALWVPPGVVHAAIYHQKTSLRYLFFRPEAAAHLPGEPAVVRLSPLLRELILAFMAYPRAAAGSGPAGRLAGVILDQLDTEPIAPLHLPMPVSIRLRSAVAELVKEPARKDTLADVAGRSALSERSFERHFRAETGLSFRAWRRQARLLKSVELLSLGISVGEVAHRLGFEGPSPFIAGFRKAFGVTPGRYFGDDA